jgi:hypothetical protein
VNLGQLKLRVSRLLGVALGTDDDAMDETEFLEELANEAVLDILTRTRVNMQETILSLNGQQEIDFSTYMLRVADVKLNGALLTEGPRDNLLSDQFAFVGYNCMLLGIIPKTGDVLTFWSSPKPQLLNDDGDDPSSPLFGGIPVIFHKAIVDYMCWWAADKLGDQQAGRGERYRGTYEGQDGLGGPGSDIGRIRLGITARGGNTLVRRRREVLFSDASGDPQFWTG